MVDCKLQLTDIGLQKQAQANVDGSIITIAHMAVGDGNGDYYTLDSSATSLVNEFYRFEVASGDISIDTINQNKIKIDGYIPATQGGNTTREIGIFNSAGDMIAHGLFPLIEIPPQDSNARIDIYIKEYLEVSNSALFEISVNQANAVITRDELDNYLPTEGGQMAGPINMDGHKIENLPNAIQADDPVLFNQFTSLLSDYVTGLELSYIDASTINISAGRCKDEGLLNLMSFTGINKKTLPWVQGSEQGAIDSGELESDTVYGVFAVGDNNDIHNNDIIFSKGITGTVSKYYESSVVAGVWSYTFNFVNPTTIDKVYFQATGNGWTTWGAVAVILTDMTTGQTVGTFPANDSTGWPAVNNLHNATVNPAWTGTSLNVNMYTRSDLGSPGSIQIFGMESIITATPSFSPVIPDGFNIKKLIGTFRTDSNGDIVPESVNGFIPQQRLFVSDKYPSVASSHYVINHNLDLDNLVQKTADVILVCKATDLNYEIGDEVLVRHYHPVIGKNTLNFTQAASVVLPHKTTGTLTNATLANWDTMFRIWY